MHEITSSPIFGIIICIFTFELGVWLNKKLKTPICNPLLIAIALIIAILSVFKIPLEDFMAGGDIVSVFLAPATAVLAISIYSRLDILKKHFLPILCGCIAGSVVSMISAVGLCMAFGLDKKLTAAMMPKSVTTPIAMGISQQHGGLVAVTVAAVIFTGILGAILSPLLIKIFKVDHPVAQGVAIGTSSHAVGTTKAVELGEIQGAMSGISIGISGIVTVIISIFVNI